MFGQFNAFCRNLRLAIADEDFDANGTLIKQIKGMSSAPMATSEGKYKPQEVIRNNTSFLAIANNPPTVEPACRRMCVIECSSRTVFCNRFMPRMMHRIGAGADFQYGKYTMMVFGRWLQSMPILLDNNFIDFNQSPPMTNIKLRCIMSNLGPVAQWWHKCMQDGQLIRSKAMESADFFHMTPLHDKDELEETQKYSRESDHRWTICTDDKYLLESFSTFYSTSPSKKRVTSTELVQLLKLLVPMTEGQVTVWLTEAKRNQKLTAQEMADLTVRFQAVTATIDCIYIPCLPMCWESFRCYMYHGLVPDDPRLLSSILNQRGMEGSSPDFHYRCKFCRVSCRSWMEIEKLGLKEQNERVSVRPHGRTSPATSPDDPPVVIPDLPVVTFYPSIRPVRYDSRHRSLSAGVNLDERVHSVNP